MDLFSSRNDFDDLKVKKLSSVKEEKKETLVVDQNALVEMVASQYQLEGEALMFFVEKFQKTYPPKAVIGMIEEFQKKSVKSEQKIQDDILKFLYEDTNAITPMNIQKLRTNITTESMEHMDYFLVDVKKMNGIKKMTQLITEIVFFPDEKSEQIQVQEENAQMILNEIVLILKASMGNVEGIKKIVGNFKLLYHLIKIVFNVRSNQLKIKVLHLLSLICMYKKFISIICDDTSIPMSIKGLSGVQLILKVFERLFSKNRPKLAEIAKLIEGNMDDKKLIVAIMTLLNSILIALSDTKDVRNKMIFTVLLYDSGIGLLLFHLRGEKYKNYLNLQRQINVFQNQTEMFINSNTNNKLQDPINDLSFNLFDHSNNSFASKNIKKASLKTSINRLITFLQDNNNSVHDIYRKVIPEDENDLIVKLIRKIKKNIASENEERDNEILELKSKLLNIRNNETQISSTITKEVTITSQKNIKISKSINISEEFSNDHEFDDDDNIPPPPSMDDDDEEDDMFNKFGITKIFNEYKEEKTRILRLKEISKNNFCKSIFDVKNITKNSHEVGKKKIIMGLIDNFQKRKSRKKIIIKRKVSTEIFAPGMLIHAGIVLGRFKHQYSMDTLYDHIKTFSIHELPLDILQRIRYLFPRKRDEFMKILYDAKHKYLKLSKDERNTIPDLDRFLARLLLIPKIYERFECWIYSAFKFDQELNNIIPSLNLIIECSKNLTSCVKFFEFMKYILIIQNVLRNKEAIYGFKITSLSTLRAIKYTGNDQKSLLDFVIENVHENDENVMKFLEKFEKFEGLKDVEMKKIMSDFNGLRKKIKEIELMVENVPLLKESEDNFSSTMKKFLIDAKLSEVDIRKKQIQTQEQFEKLSVLFGEKLEDVKNFEMFKSFIDFLEDCKASFKEVKKKSDMQKERIERSEKSMKRNRRLKKNVNVKKKKKGKRSKVDKVVKILNNGEYFEQQVKEQNKQRSCIIDKKE